MERRLDGRVISRLTITNLNYRPHYLPNYPIWHRESRLFDPASRNSVHQRNCPQQEQPAHNSPPLAQANSTPAATTSSSTTKKTSKVASTAGPHRPPKQPSRRRNYGRKVSSTKQAGKQTRSVPQSISPPLPFQHERHADYSS